MEKKIGMSYSQLLSTIGLVFVMVCGYLDLRIRIENRITIMETKSQADYQRVTELKDDFIEFRKNNEAQHQIMDSKLDKILFEQRKR